MRIDILTLFPKMFGSVLGESMLKRAQNKEKVKISIHDLRGWTFDAHRSADDKPFGGGSGMVMKVEPVYRALKYLVCRQTKKAKIILLTPQGQRFDQKAAKRLSRYKRIILICGHYE